MIGIYYVYFFFQAEDGIRDAQESRGLGDVYKRQDYSGIQRVMLETGNPVLRAALVHHPPSWVRAFPGPSSHP